MQVVPRDKPLFCGNPLENVTECSIDFECPSKFSQYIDKTMITIFTGLDILKIHQTTDFDFSPWKLVGMV